MAEMTPAVEDPHAGIFLRVVRHLPALRDDERIEAWLFQIARNAVQDALRRRHRRDSRTDPLEVDVPAEADDETRAAEAELAPCLTPMIARLAEPYRTAIELTVLQGISQPEAAKRAGISVSGMKSRVQRARERLRQILVLCCAVDVDRRGGISDYHVRDAAACGSASNASAPACGCASRSAAPPSARS